MKVIVARQLCGGHGECVAHAPEVFDFVGDDDVVSVIVARPPGDLEAAVRAASDCCPNGAITVAPAD